MPKSPFQPGHHTPTIITIILRNNFSTCVNMTCLICFSCSENQSLSLMVDYLNRKGSLMKEDESDLLSQTTRFLQHRPEKCGVCKNGMQIHGMRFSDLNYIFVLFQLITSQSFIPNDLPGIFNIASISSRKTGFSQNGSVLWLNVYMLVCNSLLTFTTELYYTGWLI